MHEGILGVKLQWAFMFSYVSFVDLDMTSQSTHMQLVLSHDTRCKENIEMTKVSSFRAIQRRQKDRMSNAAHMQKISWEIQAPSA